MSEQRPISETHPHLVDKFLPYLKLLGDESDRGRVLISTGYMEQQLADVLFAFMRKGAITKSLFSGGNAPLGTFSARIAACFALGLISDNEENDLTLLRRIRNDFAHDMHTSFETPSVVARCKALRLKARDYTSEERGEVIVPPGGQFQTSAVALILALENRPHYVAKARRSYGNWPY